MVIIGLDIGGNQIKAVTFTREEGVLGKLTRPTGRGKPADLVERIVRIVTEMTKGRKPERIGLGICALCDRVQGRIIASGAFPKLRNFKIGETLGQALDVPVSVMNDAMMATYGEWKMGAGKEKEDFVLFCIGAGVSGGAVSGGKLLVGHTRNFGGFGHISVDPDGPPCICGNRGCLCILGSSAGLARHYRDITHVDKSPEEVSALVSEGDEAANQALVQTCRCLALGIGAAINVMDPELVLIGGGMASLGDMLLDPLKKEVMGCVFPEKIAEINIECGHLGNYAGAIGAALFVTYEET